MREWPSLGHGRMHDMPCTTMSPGCARGVRSNGRAAAYHAWPHAPLCWLLFARAGRFIQRLRQAAADQPGVTMRQAFVKRLIGKDGKEWNEGEVGGMEGCAQSWAPHALCLRFMLLVPMLC